MFENKIIYGVHSMKINEKTQSLNWSVFRTFLLHKNEIFDFDYIEYAL